MKSFFYLILPALVLPVFYFVLAAYPVLNEEVEERRALLSVYDLSRQLRREVDRAERVSGDLPPTYRSILADYGELTSHGAVEKLAELSVPVRHRDVPEQALAALILWRKGLPADFLAADPVREIEVTLRDVEQKERLSDAAREKIISSDVLEYLRFEPPPSHTVSRVTSGFPPGMLEKGLVFCGERVPLERSDVRRRIEYQIAHLLDDLRETTVVWLKRKDRYGPIIKTILQKEGLPVEFALLPALESGYYSGALSPSRARGWWQFLKATAVDSLAQTPALDWSLRIDKSKDERCDLILSTRSAARYLKWLRSKLSSSHGDVSWFIAAAAYNAGLNETQWRMTTYKTASYWDIKLPLETEDYVPRWIAFAIIDEHRQFYGMSVPTIGALEFDTIRNVRLNRDLPLGVLAAITESSVRFLREINGALEKGENLFTASTETNARVHTIHIPKGTRKAVISALRTGNYLKPPGRKTPVAPPGKIGK
jgi:membrane-bound lytic murein transglycosylase D